MKSVFDKLNLRPGERRLVIVVMIVVFIVLNFIFVWPHFSDWGKLKNRRKVALELKYQYEREINNTKIYTSQLKDLERQGATVQSEAQALTLSTEVQNQAALSGVQVNRYDPVRQTAMSIGGKTNQFFEEQSGIINVTTEEKSLVDFLYNLGTGKSFIRVRSFTLNPDPPRHKLQGNVTLVASYQKKGAGETCDYDCGSDRTTARSALDKSSGAVSISICGANECSGKTRCKTRFSRGGDSNKNKPIGVGPNERLV